jgi:predicted metal-dependent hydrolase
MENSPPLPPYAYVPGGPWPHPTRDPKGHSFGRKTHPAQPLDPERWQQSQEFRRGFQLFDLGYYWEAHETWEELWHAAGRNGPLADLLRALIKIAAAGVKAREGQPHGVQIHATRALALISNIRTQIGSNQWMGLDLDLIQSRLHRAIENCETLAKTQGQLVFDWSLMPATADEANRP